MDPLANISSGIGLVADMSSSQFSEQNGAHNNQRGSFETNRASQVSTTENVHDEKEEPATLLLATTEEALQPENHYNQRDEDSLFGDESEPSSLLASSHSHSTQSSTPEHRRGNHPLTSTPLSVKTSQFTRTHSNSAPPTAGHSFVHFPQPQPSHLNLDTFAQTTMRGLPNGKSRSFSHLGALTEENKISRTFDHCKYSKSVGGTPPPETFELLSGSKALPEDFAQKLDELVCVLKKRNILQRYYDDLPDNIFSAAMQSFIFSFAITFAPSGNPFFAASAGTVAFLISLIESFTTPLFKNMKKEPVLDKDNKLIDQNVRSWYQEFAKKMVYIGAVDIVTWSMGWGEIEILFSALFNLILLGIKYLENTHRIPLNRTVPIIIA